MLCDYGEFPSQDLRNPGGVPPKILAATKIMNFPICDYASSLLGKAFGLPGAPRNACHCKLCDRMMLVMMLVHGDGDDADDDDHESDDAGHDVGDDDYFDDDDENYDVDVDGDDGNSVFLRLACSPPPLILSFRGRQSPNTTKNVFF